MSSSATARLLGERMARHGLASRTDSSVAAAARRTTALQAQDNYAARLGVRARAVGVTDAEVVSAIDADRSVVRTWLMRGTIHLVDAADARWLIALIGPSVVRRYGTRWRQLGLSVDLLERHHAALVSMLSRRALTRREIREALAGHGVQLPSGDPQIHTHAIVHASTQGLICRGPDRGRDATFVLLDEWLPGSPLGPQGDDALAALARHYFKAYSPATAADFSTWSGLPAGRAVALIESELTAVDIDGRPGYRLGSVEPARGLRLLPAFDNYLIGYRDRSAAMPTALHGHVFQGGMIRPAIVRDGRVIGTWTLDRARGRIAVSPFDPLPAAVARQVADEVADVGRFLGRELSYTVH
jgi:hypothetical protein